MNIPRVQHFGEEATTEPCKRGVDVATGLFRSSSASAVVRLDSDEEMIGFTRAMMTLHDRAMNGAQLAGAACTWVIEYRQALPDGRWVFVCQRARVTMKNQIGTNGAGAHR